MEEAKRKAFGFSSFWLHIIAMITMLCDHMWATVIPGSQWLTNIGRLAIPIYSYCIAVGFRQTKSRKKYLIRLLIAAVISEIPFNLMYGGAITCIWQQNIIWNYLLAFGAMSFIDFMYHKTKLWLTILTSTLLVAVSCVISLVLCLDGYHYVFLTVLLFYFFPGRKWWQMLIQAAGMIFIHWIWYKGMEFDVNIFGWILTVPQQGLAVFALIPIWLCNGERGYHSKVTKWISYSFYPVHMLVLSLISLFLL